MTKKKDLITMMYRCPDCGEEVWAPEGFLDLTAEGMALKCKCGMSSLQLMYTKDGRVRFTVPCFMCPDPHQYLVSKEYLKESGIRTFRCPLSPISVLYVGKKDLIVEEASKDNDEFRSLYFDEDEKDLYTLKEIGREDRTGLVGPEISEALYSSLAVLDGDGAIRCSCDLHKGEYDFFINEDQDVYLACLKCGKGKNLGMIGYSRASSLAEEDRIVLDEDLGLSD